MSKRRAWDDWRDLLPPHAAAQEHPKGQKPQRSHFTTDDVDHAAPHRSLSLLRWGSPRHYRIRKPYTCKAAINHIISFPTYSLHSNSFRSYFKSLLGSSVSPLLRINWESVISSHSSILSDLDAPFSFAEVSTVIKNSKNFKSPGPDGLILEFYKKFWDQLGPSVTGILNDLHSHPKDFSKINSAYITLIPKKKSAILATDFRPISLENSTVNIFSKLLANRLAPHMADLIFNTQATFMQGRSTLDCYIAVSETLWACNSMDQDSCVIKFDFARAFDSIGWDFIEDMLVARGFSSLWISWVLHILRSATSSVIINDSIGAPFAHKRGLRQGNPLSPLLFNLVADVLSRLISLAANSRSINGVLQDQFRGGGGGGITHILYAGDLIMFSKADPQSFNQIKLLFKCFELASGLCINLAKDICYSHRG
ncbi:hypothetical protein Cni_G04862 [Canna indica]|uniref:Reverse transcriptase domain-containing protein n=1 Tax=Canna indica TaxID=4628 RepID=A0AAQ3JXZ1_9LILI|nr:hypothetical protein Cni_G04862 [Canna indica]